MNHSQKAKWMGRLYALYDVWNMSRKDIALYGDPWQIARAHLIETPEVDWAGGEGDCNSTFDITFLVESLSGNQEYPVTYKLGLLDQTNKLEIIAIDHSCGYTRFQNTISRLPGTCIHIIAGISELQDYLNKRSKNAGGPRMKNIYHDYTKPWRFWVRKKYDRIIMTYYDFLYERDDIDSIKKRDLLYKFLYYYPR